MAGRHVGRLHRHDDSAGTARPSGGLGDAAHRLIGVARCKNLLPGRSITVHLTHKRPPLDRPAKLTARHHFLARVAALLEADALHRFVVQHLRHKGFDHRLRDASHAGAHFGQQPVGLSDGRRSGRGRAGGRQPQRARRTVGGGQVDGEFMVKLAAGACRTCAGSYRNRSIAEQPGERHVGRGVAQLGLGAQHEHRQALEGGRQRVGAGDQQQLVGGNLEHLKAGQHAALGVAKGGQARLAGLHQHDVLRELALQEAGGIVALGAHHAQVGQGGGNAVQAGGGR